MCSKPIHTFMMESIYSGMMSWRTPVPHVKVAIEALVCDDGAVSTIKLY